MTIIIYLIYILCWLALYLVSIENMYKLIETRNSHVIAVCFATVNTKSCRHFLFDDNLWNSGWINGKGIDDCIDGSIIMPAKDCMNICLI